MHLETKIQPPHGHAVVSPRGEIDLHTVYQLRRTIVDLLLGGHIHLVIDLTDTAFIDSTGLSALVGGHRKARGLQGSFSLVCSAEQILRVFRVTGLDAVFEIHRTLPEATTRPVLSTSPRLESATA